MTENKVRIFVSSPSDVEHERALVRDIVESLAHEYLPYFKVQAVLWEEEALTAAQSFQAGLLRPSECEIVLVMLWTRLGTPLADDPYGGMTGTEWEFVDAVEASSRHGRPEVLVYKKTAPRLVNINNAEATREAVADRDRLEAFFRTHFFNSDGSFRRAFRQFDSDDSFRDLVETQLRKLLNRRISAERRFAAGVTDWQGSPFRAQTPFGVGDERVFTGRESETRALVARLDGLRGTGKGLLLLTGPSGVGKTSLIRAGLLPHLARPFLFSETASCRWCLIEPDHGDPIKALADALAAPAMLGADLTDFGLDSERLARLFVSEPEVGAKQIRAALVQTAHADETRAGGPQGRLQLALILDPLDALMTESRLDSPRTQAFAAALAALAVQDGIWVLAALRSDRLPRLPRLSALAALLDEQGWFRLEAPAPARIRQVMEIPARVAGIEYEEAGKGGGHGLVETLESEASALPHWPALLEQTLEDLYQQSRSGAETSVADQDGRLRLRDYQTIGGLTGVLLRRADALWEDLDEDSRGALPTVCRALITLDGGSRSRASARAGDLQTLLGDPGCAALIQSFIRARLIVAEAAWDPARRLQCAPIELKLGEYVRRTLIQIREEWRARFSIARARASLDDLLDASPSVQASEGHATIDWRDYRSTVSFMHPALFERWGPARDWLANPDNRRDLNLRARITRQANLWKRTDCNREYLLGEVGHAAARVFARAHWRELDPLEHEFLDQSWSRLRLQRRRNRQAIGATMAILLTLAGIATFSVWDASHQAQLTLQRGFLREADIAIGRGNTPKAVHLALNAGPDLPEAATDTLSRALSSNRLLAMTPPLTVPPNQIHAPAFRDDGEQLATLTQGDGAQLWVRRKDGFQQEAILSAPELPIHSVHFVGHGESSMLIGIGNQGIWRLPTQAGQAPDWPRGGREGTDIALDPQGQFLAIVDDTAPGKPSLCLLDLTRPGAPLWELPQTKRGLRSLAFAPDGKRLVSASRDGLARVMDSQTGSELLVLPRTGPLGRPATRAVFSPDGQRVAVATLDELVRIYDQRGKEVAKLGAMRRGQRSIRIHQSSIRALAFSPDGQSLAVGDGTGQIARWDLNTGMAEVLGQHDLGVKRLSISPGVDPILGEPLVLSVSQDRTARLWSLDTGREVAVFSHDAAISGAGFSRDGQLIMTAAQPDGSARLWSTAPANPLAFRLEQDAHVRHLAMAASPVSEENEAPDSGSVLIATAGFDGRVEVWKQDRSKDATAPVKLLSLTGHQELVRKVGFSPSVEWLASAGYDGTARLWKLATGDACRLRVASQRGVCRTDGAADCPNVYQILFAPDEHWLLTASKDPDQPIRFWEPSNCKALPLPDAFKQDKGGVRAAAMKSVSDGRILVATGNNEGKLHVLLRDQQGFWASLCRIDAHQSAITEVTFSRDGRWLAAASRDGRASLYPVTEELDGYACGEPLYMDGQAGRVYDVQFAPDSKALVTSSLESMAHLWSLDGTLLAELGGHKNRVTSAEFSPDGHWILTASRDGTVRVWRRPLRAQTQPLEAYLTLDADLGGVAHASFSPDGQNIGAGYWENAALLWRLWAEDPKRDRDLEKIWGQDRSRLVVIREALRFQAKHSSPPPENPSTFDTPFNPKTDRLQ